MPIRPSVRLASVAFALAVLAAGTVATVRTVRASDHQDTPEVELNQRMDINDVYAFPGATSVKRPETIRTDEATTIIRRMSTISVGLKAQMKACIHG